VAKSKFKITSLLGQSAGEAAAVQPKSVDKLKLQVQYQYEYHMDMDMAHIDIHMYPYP
tara:strand:- start:67 stop:240 length:174 start_codon:yes stop_codon:yes gene_type:complete